MKSFKKTYENKNLNCIHASIHGKAEHFDISEAIATNDEIKSNFELAGRLTKHYSDLLTDKTAKSNITNYTEHSHYINTYLWSKHKQPDSYKKTNEINSIDKHAESTIKNINKILHSHKSPENMTVWSSSIHDPEKLKNKEGIVHHPAFLSTSTYRHVALNRDINQVDDKDYNLHHHVYKIHVPQGSPGAYVDHISKYPGEYEFLLPSGQNLRHIKTTTTHTPYKHYSFGMKKKYLHIHEMELQNE